MTKNGIESSKYGVAGGNKHEYDATGHRIAGVLVKSGGFIDSVTFFAMPYNENFNHCSRELTNFAVS